MLAIKDFIDKNKSLAVVGLGYVGLPLAVALARHFKVLGFDINPRRIAELQQGRDVTREVEDRELRESSAVFSDNADPLKEAAVIIVAVPTPIDNHNNPDLKPVVAASRTVGQNLAAGSVVVYESTVYPGVTEDICVPILEQESGLKLGRGFSVGYSPERINPGDKVHTLENITKIVSGSDTPTREFLSRLYGTVVQAGIHQASSIKVAEAAKVIENTQRDINIALMNELSFIFEKLGIDTLSVLEAAGSKWNFLPFRPGLVGGHCIGVDPYYLTYKAQEVGYHPEIILSGRRVNDCMGKYVADSCVKNLIKLNCHITGARVGILGITFKENVPDIRNSRVVEIIDELNEYGINVLVSDALADRRETWDKYAVELLDLEAVNNLDALIVAVPHDEYAKLSAQKVAAMFRNPECVLVMDIKGLWDPEELARAGLKLWRL